MNGRDEKFNCGIKRKERKIKLIQLKEIYKNQRNQNIIKC